MTKVYFATNRDLLNAATGEFGERFNAEGPQFYRVGSAELDPDPTDADSAYVLCRVVVELETPPADLTGEGAVFGSSALFRSMRTEVKAGGRDVVVLIHGFACKFTDSVKRAAQIKGAYVVARGEGEAKQPEVVVFSWPSNGRTLPPWEYSNDRDDAEASGKAMARFLMRFIDFLRGSDERCDQRLHLVAHSMGNWALRHAVQGIRALLDQSRLPTLFDNVFLMAADEDEDALEHEHKLGLLPQLCRAIHVYHSSSDGALVISDTTKFNPDRLGADGPKTFSGLSNRIVAIDCGAVDYTEVVHANHQYYRLRSEVIADVRHVLSARYRPDAVPSREVVEPGRRYRLQR